MIIVRIVGGLGNQLFQYAAAKALAEKHGVMLKLDIAGFPGDTLRRFDLTKFSIPLAYASAEDIKKRKAGNALQRVTQRLLPHAFKTFYKEPHFHFDPSFFRLGKEVYLQGFFQSEKYFHSIQNHLRKEFDVSHLVNQSIKALAAELKKEDSISLHIRRGDYLDEAILKYHGILPATYYRGAIDLLKRKYPAARFYLFSDHPVAASKELALPDVRIISGTITSNHFEDLYLMQHCRHNIIANSSFSWWAAWLNTNPGKTVVAPKNWFNEGPKDTQDLLPETWIRV